MFEILKTKDKQLSSRVKVNKSTNCWEWQGHRNRKGYGIVRRRAVRNSPLLTHRYVWELFSGPIDLELIVCHTCDNPPCCNPDHLFIGTHQENSDDMWEKGRQNPVRQKGKENSRAVLTESDIPDIIKKWEEGTTQRQIAREYNVSHDTIHLIVKNKSWKHVPR